MVLLLEAASLTCMINTGADQSYADNEGAGDAQMERKYFVLLRRHLYWYENTEAVEAPSGHLSC